MKNQVVFYKLWKLHSNRFKPERILACYLRKFGQILICEKKATEGFAANAGLFVCLSHSFWQSKHYPFSVFTLTNHTWPGNLRSRWYAEDNINNNNMAICCTSNKLVHRKRTATQPWFFKFQLMTPIEKKMGKRKNTYKGIQIQRRANGGNMRRRGRPKAKTPQDALTCSFLEVHEIHWVGFTLFKAGKLTVWKTIAWIGTLSFFYSLQFFVVGTGAWRFWLCGFLEILLLRPLLFLLKQWTTIWFCCLFLGFSFFFSFQNRTEQVRVSFWDFALRIDWRHTLETTSCEMSSETCTFGKSCETRN